MAVFVTGDTHGSHDIGKLGQRRFDARGLTRDDFMVILGDFGFPWRIPEDAEDRYWLNWLESKPWTTLVVDGNHENHEALGMLPMRPWHGGLVHELRPHVLHLCRANVFKIGGDTFFAMGGAASHDNRWRTPHRSWWPEEVPSEDERVQALFELSAFDWQVGYVLSHEAPAGAFGQLYAGAGEGAGREPDEYAEWLEGIARDLRFERWFFGHHHMDISLDGGYTCCYQGVYDLDGNLSERVMEKGRRSRR